MNNRGRRAGFQARTTEQQQALEQERAAFRSTCPQCRKHRRTCPVCAGVF